MRKDIEVKKHMVIVVLIGSSALGALEGFLIGTLVGQLPLNNGVKGILVVGLSAVVGYGTGYMIGRKWLT